MGQFIRRLQGAVALGIAWAIGWAPIGAVLGVVLHLVMPGNLIGLGALVGLNAGIFAALGLVGGSIFGGILSLTERRRRFDELSRPRFAVWGGLGGLVLGALAVTANLWGMGFAGVGLAMAGAVTALGAASAAATLTIARTADESEPPGLHAPEPDPALGAGDPPPRAGGAGRPT